jgi:hypothetical protein
MPPDQAGVASAVASTSRLVGVTLGVAVGGAIAGGATGHIGAGFAASTHPAWWLMTAFGVAVLALGAITTTERATARAAQALA